jgi:FtsP/CotA-like multicopper oxidase with cupredoxin domain
MRRSFLSLLALAAVGAAVPHNLGSEISPRSAARDNSGLSPGCKNAPKSRKCWGKYDINTNPYDTVFYTGRTVEYWLNIEEIDCAPDGYQRKCMVANGTMPGPAIVADWGDNIVVHVTNNVATNGTSIHWHGMRQLNNNQYDGAPGVTQCPLAPGQSMTYKFHASQYGTAMYHSHFSVQYSMGLYGPLIINGPATADYDEDLGSVFMNDWGHETEFYRWATVDNFNVSFEGAPLRMQPTPTHCVSGRARNSNLPLRRVRSTAFVSSTSPPKRGFIPVSMATE